MHPLTILCWCTLIKTFKAIVKIMFIGKAKLFSYMFDAFHGLHRVLRRQGECAHQLWVLW